MPIICIHVVVIWHTSLQHVLTPLCIGNELFFTSVYLLYFHSGPGNNVFSVAYINIQPLLMFLQFCQYLDLEHGGLFCLAQHRYSSSNRWSVLFNLLMLPRKLSVWIELQGSIVRQTVTKLLTSALYCHNNYVIWLLCNQSFLPLYCLIHS